MFHIRLGRNVLVTDFLDAKSREIADRMAKLKPLLDEYSRLEAAATVLSGIPGSTNGGSSPAPRSSSPGGARRGPGRPRGSKNKASAATTAPRATRKPRGKSGAPGRRKGSGKRTVEALALVTAQPGIAIPELAEKMDINQNYLYRVLPGLEQEKKVVKKGRGWHPQG
jgi:hypothetical protein